MAYDEDLAERIRELITASHEVTEQKMFGGLAFLVGRHVSVTASREGDLLVRVDPATAEHLLATTNAHEMVMRGRPMPGWLRVPATDVRTKPQLRKWVDLGADYAASLPPKTRKQK